jgi:hypothetical protein
MRTTIMLALGAVLAAAAVQFPGAALAAKKGSERGVIAIIKPGETRRSITDAKSKQDSKRRVPYVEQKHKKK